MRFLKYDLYEGGHVGFFNNLMSLELGVGLSVLLNRFLLLSAPPRPIFNSESHLTVVDFVDVFHPHQVGSFDGFGGELLPDLHSTQVSTVDCDHYKNVPLLATRNASTLGYYSYTLPFDQRVIYACNYLIQLKEPYRNLARLLAGEIRRQYGQFASIHVRRADFLADHAQAEAVTADEICKTLQSHIAPDTLLVIHSDESDPDFFRPIHRCYPKHLMIDALLYREFYPHRMDSAECGLVSALVACESDMFLGTMFSTFTGYIQRKRLLNGRRGGFLYLYNQRPDCLAFQNGRILESSASGPTWQRIGMSDDLRSICFWWREWPEAVYSRTEEIPKTTAAG